MKRQREGWVLSAGMGALVFFECIRLLSFMKYWAMSS